MSEELNKDDSQNDEAPSSGLPDEVLVDTPAKLAHEDLVPETEKVAEANDTRGGEDFEGAKAAAELNSNEE